eukprot:6997943-Alexandrium_andersonii.AAC.1
MFMGVHISDVPHATAKPTLRLSTDNCLHSQPARGCLGALGRNCTANERTTSLTARPRPNGLAVSEAAAR